MSAGKGSINTEEKRKHIKSLIEKIPTARPELFSYPLDWAMVDSVKKPVEVFYFYFIHCIYPNVSTCIIKPCDVVIVPSVDSDGSPH